MRGEPASRGGTAVPMAATRAGQAPTPGGSRVPVYQHRGVEGTTPEARCLPPESLFLSTPGGMARFGIAKWLAYGLKR
ncbi:Uncharacterized protein DAT39_023698, partial [Clarias magur]